MDWHSTQGVFMLTVPGIYPRSTMTLTRTKRFLKRTEWNIVVKDDCYVLLQQNCCETYQCIAISHTNTYTYIKNKTIVLSVFCLLAVFVFHACLQINWQLEPVEEPHVCFSFKMLLVMHCRKHSKAFSHFFTFPDLFISILSNTLPTLFFITLFFTYTAIWQNRRLCKENILIMHSISTGGLANEYRKVLRNFLSLCALLSACPKYPPFVSQ